MNEKAKNRLLWYVIFFIAGAIIVLNVMSAPDEAVPTGPTYITLPTPEPLDRNDPNFTSPYNPDILVAGMMKIVWNESLVFDDIQLQTSSAPDIQMNNTIDVEDVVSIKLPRQSLKCLPQNAGILVVPLSEMKDPYLTSVSQYDNAIKVPFTMQEDGTWLTQFTLGYSENIPAKICVLLYYEEDIEAFITLKVTVNNMYSEAYYKWLHPDVPISTFIIKIGDNTETYCFYPEETPTLQSWIDSYMNHDAYHAIHGFMVDKSVKYHTLNTTDIALTDEMVIVMQAFDTQLPVDAYQFNTEASQLYALMGTTQENVQSVLGEATYIVSMSHITKLEYTNYIVYIDNTQGVVQIDIMPNVQEFLQGLPYQPCTGEKLCQYLRSNVIPCNQYTNRSDIETQYHAYALPIPVGEYTVSYVWEATQQFNPDYTEFTRIVIHSGEEYIY
ncbi:MAG: hypothetical protein IJZ68_06775 [Bacteroidaceae bacterium]|nr:hypothetical protein [Bacteroidaceae bacterium]